MSREFDEQLHYAQVAILDALRHAPALRFTDLMKPTGMTSDSFKFHLRKLDQLGYVAKTDAGLYRLTAAGKEFANRLDTHKRAVQSAPKLSLLLLVPKPGAHEEPTFLFQQRLRNPYFGFWSCIGGPIHWGEAAEEAAVRELGKQTGLQATCTVHGMYRVRDYDATDRLLEDKLFIIMQARDLQGEITHNWPGGTNQWMTERELRQQPKYFTSVCKAIEMVRTGQTYLSEQLRYQPEDY